MLQLV